MTWKHWLISMGTAIVLIIATAVVTLLASGYRFNLQEGSVEGTGIIAVSSVPDGALVYINGVPKDATNTSITDLKPDTYTLRLEKLGFATWEKQVEVQKELVSKESALLIPLSPELKPLTVIGVAQPSFSPDGQKVVFTARSNGQSGVWFLDVFERPFDLANKPVLLLEDTADMLFSSGKLYWAPNSNQFVVQLTNKNGEIETVQYDLATNERTTVTDFELLQKDWAVEKQKVQESIVEGLEEDIVAQIGALPNPVWSPDNTKALYKVAEESGIDFYHVFDLKPDVLGESKPKPADVVALESSVSAYTLVRWYADSQHLIILEKDNEEDMDGTISIIEIDSTNKTKVFNGTLADNIAYSSPNGSRLIVLTNFNPQSEQYNLYAIGLR